MAYLNKDGSTTYALPDLDLFVNDEPDMSTEVSFEVVLLNEENEAVGVEPFDSYPKPDSIKWCLLKHKAAKASVRKIYYLTL